MAASPRSGSLGLPLYEWVIVVLVAALVAFGVWWRVDDLLEIAERERFTIQLLELRTGLRLQLADQIIHARVDIPTILATNPLQWLQTAPPGAVDSMAALQDGGWYYDRVTRQLLYRPSRGGGIEPAGDGLIRLMLYLPLGTEGSQRDAAFGIRLCPTATFVWQGKRFVGGDDCRAPA